MMPRCSVVAERFNKAWEYKAWEFRDVQGLAVFKGPGTGIQKLLFGYPNTLHKAEKLAFHYHSIARFKEAPRQTRKET